jgi:hypothetical protein
MLSRRVLLVSIAILIVAGCGVTAGTAPPPTPADFLGITGSLVRRGIAIDRPRSGDAGCSDPMLARTAISFDASGLDQPQALRVYLYIFGNRDSYDRLRSTIANCARTYIARPDATEVVDAPPFVLVGQGPWGPRFAAALREGLVEAAGSGS